MRFTIHIFVKCKSRSEDKMNKDPRIEKVENLLDKFGNIAVEAFHYIALFNLSSMKYFSFLASFGKLAYLDLSNKPL